MTILSTNMFFERATFGLDVMRNRAQNLQAQISSGERLGRSSDDPVAASRLRSLERASELTAINTRNANRANSDLSLADGALTEIADNLMRAQELAAHAANDTLNDTQRAAIGEQLASIRSQLIALANSRDSAGHALFGGEASGDAYTLDGGGNAVYAGTASSGELALGDGQSVVRGVTGPEIFNFSHEGSSTDLFAVLGNLATALQSGAGDPAAAANAALGAMSAGLEKITTTQTVIGARMNWVDFNLARHERLGEVRTAEQGEIGGVDPATAMIELQEMMTVMEASQASFVKLANLSLFNVLR